jgi:murein DD-endopeptidase MepM/ murein hydrolase activator NlpD
MTSPERPTRPRGSEPRYTLLIVPEGGAGSVRQFEVRLGQVRLAVGAGAALAAALVIGLAALSTRFGDDGAALDGLVQENLDLHERLHAAETELHAAESLVERVRAYDEQLRSLEQRNGLPGFGPLEPGEADARAAWIEGREASVAPGAGSGRDRAADVLERAEALRASLAEVLPGLDRLDARIDAMEAVRSVLPQRWPLDMDQASLSSNWGWRRSPFNRSKWGFHAGLDMSAPSGTPILATNDGLVAYAAWEGGYGQMIDLDHGDGVISRYAHASKLLVEAGQSVSVGDVIALVGSTGRSTGPHLHYELRFEGESVDPLEYLP